MDLFRRKIRSGEDLYEFADGDGREGGKRARKIDNVYKIVACVLGALWLLSIIKPIDIKLNMKLKSIKDIKYIFNEKRGNTIGNDSNFSMAVKKGDYIYYVNLEDDKKIYRIKSNGSQREKFLEDSGTCLNIIGNDLYYINESDGKKIYKVNLKSKEKSKLTDDSGQKMVISGGLIYYIKDYTENLKKSYKNDSSIKLEHYQCIFRMKLNGSDKKKITGKCTDFNVYNGRIYYLNQWAGNKLYRINKDGSDNIKISGDNLWRFWMDERYIYYMNNPGGSDRPYLARINHDGTKKVKIYDDLVDCFNTQGDNMHFSFGIGIYGGDRDGKNIKMPVNSIKHNIQYVNIVGNWIYWGSDNYGLFKTNLKVEKMEQEPEVAKKLFITNVKDEDNGENITKYNINGMMGICAKGNLVYASLFGKMFKFKGDGSQAKVVIDNFNGSNILVNDGYIYYIDYMNGNKIYRIKDGGTEGELFFNEKVSSFLIKGDYLFYSRFRDEGNGLYRIKLDGSDNKKIIDKPVYCAYYTKDYIIYSGSNPNVYRCDLEGKNEKELYVPGFDFAVWDKYIYEGSFGILRTEFKLDTSQSYIICEGRCRVVAVDEEYIYFNNEDEGAFYRVKKDGTGALKLYSRQVSQAIIAGDYIYYQDIEGGETRRVKKDGSNDCLLEEVVTKVPVGN